MGDDGAGNICGRDISVGGQEFKFGVGGEDGGQDYQYGVEGEDGGQEYQF